MLSAAARSPGFAQPPPLGRLQLASGTPPSATRKAPVFSRVLGSPTNAAADTCVSSLSFSFGSERVGGATSTAIGPNSSSTSSSTYHHHYQPTAPPPPAQPRAGRPRGASGSSQAAGPPPGPMGSMPLPIGEFPKRSFVSRLDASLGRVRFQMVTSNMTLAHTQSTPPPPKPTKPTPASRKRPRRPPKSDMHSAGVGNLSAPSAFGSATRFPPAPAVAAALPVFKPEAMEAAEDVDEREILAYLAEGDLLADSDLLGDDDVTLPGGGPTDSQRPAVSLPVDPLPCASVSTPDRAGGRRKAEIGEFGEYSSPPEADDLPRGRPAFTTSPFDMIKARSRGTPGSFSLHEINQRINSPRMRVSRTKSALPLPLQRSFRPIDPDESETELPDPVMPIPPDANNVAVPCDLSEDEGVCVGDRDDEDPLSVSAMELLMSAFGEPDSNNNNHHASGGGPKGEDLTVLMDTTGCGLGPVEQLRSFSPTMLFSGDAPEAMAS